MEKKFDGKSLVIGGFISFAVTLASSILFFHYEQKNALPTEVILKNLPEILVEINNEYPAELNEALNSLNLYLQTPGAAANDKNQETNSEKNKSEVNNHNITEPVYIGDQIKAYYYGSYFTEYAPGMGTSFLLGGVSYNRGFTIGLYQANACYNIDAQYTKLSGIVGNVDGFKIDETYNIVGDGKLLATINVVGAALPVAFEADVTGIKQLSIEIANSSVSGGEPVGFANVILE